MRKLYILLKLAFFTFCLASAFAVAVVYGIFWYFSKDLPKIDSLKDYHPLIVSEVFSDNGTKIGEYWIEKRIPLKPHEIPKVVEQAIVASEDDRFFDHSGIDYFGIFRAMIENLKAGEIVQGGSTITQQVVKSLILTKERTYERKIKEAILAKRLEDNLDKQEILYLYLNQIYLGNRAYGIEAAAQNYFHKTAKELNIAEAAMIAGLAKAPSASSPIENWERSKERQKYVIERMLDEGFISEMQKDRALNMPLQIYAAPTDKEGNLRYAPWFVEEVRREIIKKYGEQVPYTHGLKIYTTLDLKAQKAADAAVARGVNELHKRHGYNGPLAHLKLEEFSHFNANIHEKMYRENLEPGFLLNLSSEEIAKKQANPQKGMYQGLITALDHKTITVQVGKVSGIIIQRDFGWARERNNNAHGYDDVIYLPDPKKRFQVGDVIEVKVLEEDRRAQKPDLYPEGGFYFTLEETPKVEGALFSYDPHTGFVKAIVGGRGFSESEFNRATQALRQTGSVFKPFLYTSALDKGYTKDTTLQDSPLRIPDGPGRVWEPKNYGGGFKGPIPFRSALVHSRNVPTVRIILDIGTDYVAAFLRKLGVTTKIDKVYAMALGANDMKLSEVSRAFGTFPTGGILPDLIFVKRIVDRFGNTMEENAPKVVVNFQDQIKNGDLQKIGNISYEPQNTRQYLRDDLYDEAKTWIQKSRLDLTPYEEIILYGKHLPKGYVLNPRTAYTMVELMQDIVNYGTGYRVHALGRPVAGKTGTTNDLTDCWFVGYVPDLVAGVWTGYDQNKYKVGGGETGGKAAAPIFLYYMQNYLEGTPVKNFEIPREIENEALNSPVPVYPGNINDLLGDPYGDGNSADFFIEDI